MSFLDLSDKQVQLLNKKTRKDTEFEYKEFITSFNKQRCYICKCKIIGFKISKPCVHWLLRPLNITKKDIIKVIEKFGYFRPHSYLRWVANTERAFGNINDLRSEQDPGKVIENTIKFSKLEWSFSCTKGDLQGHPNSNFGKEPHFHMQMKINNRPFFVFNDYHFNFTDEDLFNLKVISGQIPYAKHSFNYGIGIEDVLKTQVPEDIINNSVRSDNEAEALFKFDTYIEAENGKNISGDELSNIIKEHKETNVPLAKLLKKLSNVKSLRTIITPSNSIPQIQQRKKSRSSKKAKQ